MKKKKLNFKSITTIISFLALFMAVGVFFYSCADDPVMEDGNTIRLDLSEKDAEQEYLDFVSNLPEDKNTFDIRNLPKELADQIDSGIRSQDCDFDIADNPGTSPCSSLKNYEQILYLWGCYASVTAKYKVCVGGTTQIWNLNVSATDPGCTIGPVFWISDINSYSFVPGNFNAFENIVFSFCLSKIEDFIAVEYDEYQSDTYVVTITSVSPKRCWAYCSGEYKACGKRCCIRTRFKYNWQDGGGIQDWGAYVNDIGACENLDGTEGYGQQCPPSSTCDDIGIPPRSRCQDLDRVW